MPKSKQQELDEICMTCDCGRFLTKTDNQSFFYCEDCQDYYMDDHSKLGSSQKPFPNTLKIGPYTYNIERTENLKGDDGENLYGQIIYADTLIKIDSQHDEQRQGAALIHEVLHGILEQAGLDGTREKVIVVLGNGLFDFLRQNKEVIEYIYAIPPQPQE